MNGATGSAGQNAQCIYDHKCWSCTKNIEGKDCIEFTSYKRGWAWCWASTGFILFVMLQMAVEDRFLSIAEAVEKRSSETVFVGALLLIITFMVAGFALKNKLTHPYEYAIVTFTGPMGLYAAVPIVIDFIAK